MLVIKVELWPFGIEANKEEIARATITNDGTGDRLNGNYDVKFFIKGTNRVGRKARVEGHKRLGEPVWNLIKKAIFQGGY